MPKSATIDQVVSSIWEVQMQKRIAWLRYLILPSIIAVIIGLLMNQIANSRLIYSLGISMVYALSCGFIVVFPVCHFGSRFKHVFANILFLFPAVTALTVVATILAEILLSFIIAEFRFVLFGEINMFLVNTMLSLLCIFAYRVKHRSKGTLGDGFISFRTSNGIQMLKEEDVRFLYAKNKYVFVNVGDSEFLADKTLQAFDNELSDMFLRVSRSYILNTVYIKQVKKDTKGKIWFHLSSDHHPPIKAGVTYQRKLKHLITA